MPISNDLALFFRSFILPLYPSSVHSGTFSGDMAPRITRKPRMGAWSGLKGYYGGGAGGRGGGFPNLRAEAPGPASTFLTNTT